MKVNQQNEIRYTLDARGNFTFLNEAGERILGYSCAEAQRMNVTQVLAPEMAAPAWKDVQSISWELLGGVYEIDIITKGGTRITMEISTSLIWREGLPAGLQGFAVPIVHHVEQTAHLRQRCLDRNFFVGTFT